MKLAPKDVVKVVSKCYGISQQDLRNPDNRDHWIADIRHIIFYLALKHTTSSGSEIARDFGKKRNSSVFNGRAKIEARLQTDAKLRTVIEGLERELLLQKEKGQ